MLAVLPACHRQTAASAEQAVLERRREGLAGLMAAAHHGTLLPFDKMLVAVDEGLVRQVIAATLPFERVIVDRYRIRVSRADVHFDDGFGLGDTGFAGLVGAGWEVRVGRRFYLNPAIDLIQHRYTGRGGDRYRERIVNFGIGVLFQSGG